MDASMLLGGINPFIHWGRVTHTCVSNLTIIASDNGLSPGLSQAIIWSTAGIFLIRPLGTNLPEILIAIHIFSLKKIHLKLPSAKRQPFCLGLNVLLHWGQAIISEFWKNMFYFMTLIPNKFQLTQVCSRWHSWHVPLHRLRRHVNSSTPDQFKKIILKQILIS